MKKTMPVPIIRKEWERWMRARKRGYTGDIVWSDSPEYKTGPLYDEKEVKNGPV